MRKLRVLSIILALSLFLLPAYSQQQEKKIIDKNKIEFTTKDNFILVGDLYFAKPATKKPLVVALHSFGVNAQSWQIVAKNLRQNGYNVLAMDLRGHGRSVYNSNLKINSRFRFNNDDWAKLPQDVIEAIAYIQKNHPDINCKEVILMGADLGANTALLAGNKIHPEPQKMVLISPILNFKGLYIPYSAAKYKKTKFLVLLSKADKILFNFHTIDKPVIKQYVTGGQGNFLLKTNPVAVDDIVKFIIN